ncbi:hypothetical protein [Magnetofaba australis]|uniref:Uncharacterized protein n=1 Tax=Magnetofaba australis IT-1 TaxID=1434232 RepID=A0A1Y2K870_9PROT|nr:hypothetical protein [Magnetofaba australis]OSM04866.1 hypothetical protein MAIT1_02964 [Magnetofaba australis IT-1]
MTTLAPSDANLEPLAQLLSKMLGEPRHMTTRMGGLLCARFETDHPFDAIEQGSLETLEDFEVEHLLARLFTPSNAQREAAEAFLPDAGIDAQWERDQVGRWRAEELSCELIFGQRSMRFIIPEVLLERFLSALNADRPIDPEVARTLSELEPEQGPRERARRVGRLPIWDEARRRNILLPWLQRIAQAAPRLNVERMAFLSEFVRSYRPLDVPALVTALRNLVDSYENGGDGAYAKGVEAHESGCAPSSGCSDDVKKHRLAMAKALLTEL